MQGRGSHYADHDSLENTTPICESDGGCPEPGCGVGCDWEGAQGNRILMVVILTQWHKNSSEHTLKMGPFHCM